jgi:hypothetical protein
MKFCRVSMEFELREESIPPGLPLPASGLRPATRRSPGSRGTEWAPRLRMRVAVDAGPRSPARVPEVALELVRLVGVPREDPGRRGRSGAPRARTGAGAASGPRRRGRRARGPCPPWDRSSGRRRRACPGGTLRATLPSGQADRGLDVHGGGKAGEQRKLRRIRRRRTVARPSGNPHRCGILAARGARGVDSSPISRRKNEDAVRLAPGSRCALVSVSLSAQTKISGTALVRQAGSDDSIPGGRRQRHDHGISPRSPARGRRPIEMAGSSRQGRLQRGRIGGPLRKSKDHGVHVGTMANGDKYYVHFQGTGTSTRITAARRAARGASRAAPAS